MNSAISPWSWSTSLGQDSWRDGLCVRVGMWAGALTLSLAAPHLPQKFYRPSSTCVRPAEDQRRTALVPRGNVNKEPKPPKTHRRGSGRGPAQEPPSNPLESTWVLPSPGGHT